MQFVVPQFIDVEDKILGPLSVRQFVILLVTFGLLTLGFRFLPFVAFLLFAIVIVGLSSVFAFAKINGQPFHEFLLNLTRILRTPRLKVWVKSVGPAGVARPLKQAPKEQPIVLTKPALPTSRLTQLSLVVDTGGAYQEEEDTTFAQTQEE